MTNEANVLPAEAIPQLTDDELCDAIQYADESWFWPEGGEKVTTCDVLLDLQATRAEVERLRAIVRAAGVPKSNARLFLNGQPVDYVLKPGRPISAPPRPPDQILLEGPDDPQGADEVCVAKEIQAEIAELRAALSPSTPLVEPSGVGE